MQLSSAETICRDAEQMMPQVPDLLLQEGQQREHRPWVVGVRAHSSALQLLLLKLNSAEHVRDFGPRLFLLSV
jgi:hypothetical protein